MKVRLNLQWKLLLLVAVTTTLIVLVSAYLHSVFTSWLIEEYRYDNAISQVVTVAKRAETNGYFGSTTGTGQVFAPPPTINFEDLGLVLKVTPHVHGVDEVSLDIDAEDDLRLRPDQTHEFLIQLARHQNRRQHRYTQLCREFHMYPLLTLDMTLSLNVPGPPEYTARPPSRAHPADIDYTAAPPTLIRYNPSEWTFTTS